MWRPSMFLLCLIAALAGSPLRQAEAAGDLARSIAEMGGDVLRAVDGGVGDDDGETILPAPSGHGSGAPAIDPGHRIPMHLLAPLAFRVDGRCPPLLVPTGIADPARRIAWLQSLRF